MSNTCLRVSRAPHPIRRPIPINFVPTNFFPLPPPFETGRKSRVRDSHPYPSTRVYILVSAFTIQSTIPSPPLYRSVPRAHHSNGRRLKGAVVNFLFNFFACIASWMKRRGNFDTCPWKRKRGKDRGLKGGESRKSSLELVIARDNRARK